MKKTKEKKKVFKQKVRKVSIWWKLLLPVMLIVFALCALIQFKTNKR